MKKTKKKKVKIDPYVCNNCGSIEVMLEAYVDLNTKEYIDDIGDSQCCCQECDCTITPIKKSAFKKDDDNN